MKAAGDGRLDGQAFVRYGMGKRHRTCVEHKRIPLVARAPNGASIQLVSKQGESKRCEVHSDLMFTSRQKLDVKQGKFWGMAIARPCCNDADARPSSISGTRITNPRPRGASISLLFQAGMPQQMAR